jgi:hypothetical protein
MSNETLDALALLLVAVQAGVMAWALMRREVTAVVVLNLLGATGVLIAIAPELIAYETLAEDFVRFLVALLVFEAVTLATSLAWFARQRLAWLVWTEFAVHAALSLAVLIFVFTFRITRLM